MTITNVVDKAVYRLYFIRYNRNVIKEVMLLLPCSSAVELCTVNALVAGSNPAVAAMNEKTLVDLRNKVRQSRKRKQITQCQLAEMVGTKQSSISRFENGNYFPSLFFLTKIANSLNSEVVINFKTIK